MTAGELKFLNALNAIPGVGAVTLRALKERFGNFEEAWRAGDGALSETPLEPLPRTAILAHRSSIQPDREMETLVREHIWILTEEDPTYPTLLKEIPSPPYLLYGRGDPSELETVFAHTNPVPATVGIVGTRKPTVYGLEATASIAEALAAAGITIVSGLAVGIDAKAHESALAVQGRTIAVLGSGIDPASIFPPENRVLADRIAAQRGLLLSEYAAGAPALREHFPQRNRIISGLSRGVVVVEARERSGALITARLALDQNRDVFAIPGSIFTPTAYGPLRLIQQGAKPVLTASDILEEWGMVAPQLGSAAESPDLAESERRILEALEEPLDVDALKQRLGGETHTLLASLSLLELKGYIRNLGNDTYQKIII